MASVAPIGGVTREMPYGSDSGCHKNKDLFERVVIAAGSNQARLNQRLPPRALVIAAQLLLATAVGVSGNGGTNGTAGAIALVAHSATALATGTALSTSNIIGWAGGVSNGSSSFARAVNFTQNTTSSWLYLYLVPAASGAAQVFNIQSDTTGYKFVGTATDTNTYLLDVDVPYTMYAPLVAA